MMELDLTNLLLTAMNTYGPWTLGLVALLGALGVPTPTPLLVLAVGAFARQGLMDWRGAIILCLLGGILGESATYALGRLAGGWVQRHTGRLLAAVWRTAQERFEQHKALTVYLTRFLLTPLAIPTNLIAGAGSYPCWRFLTIALAGDLVWVLLYGGLGYTLGNGAEVISQSITRYSGWLGGLSLVIIAACNGVRRLHADHHIPRHLTSPL